MEQFSNFTQRDSLAFEIYTAMVGGMYSTNFRPNPVAFDATVGDAYKLADAFLATQAKQGGK